MGLVNNRSVDDSDCSHHFNVACSVSQVIAGELQKRSFLFSERAGNLPVSTKVMEVIEKK
jgi:hypothetical protein